MDLDIACRSAIQLTTSWARPLITTFRVLIPRPASSARFITTAFPRRPQTFLWIVRVALAQILRSGSFGRFRRLVPGNRALGWHHRYHSLPSRSIVNANTGTFITNNGSAGPGQMAEIAPAETGGVAFNPFHGTFLRL